MQLTVHLSPSVELLDEAQADPGKDFFPLDKLGDKCLNLDLNLSLQFRSEEGNLSSL